MVLLGVVGGVGPEASNKFCEYLVTNKNKRRDQDNIPFIHFSNPLIPDRTQAILSNGDDPVPALVDTSKVLESAGANVLIIPCNTAHHFLDRIQSQVNVPIINIIDVLVREVVIKNPSVNKIGILATTGTIATRIYHKRFESVGIELITLSPSDQENLVMDAIYGSDGIKAGGVEIPKKLLNIAIDKLLHKGVDAIVLGCTELPLVLSQKDFNIKLYEPMQVVANNLIGAFEDSFVDVINNDLRNIKVNLK